MLTKSSDGGKTFSHPRLILPMDYEVMSGGNNLMSKVGRGVEHTHMHTYYKYIYSACKKKKKQQVGLSKRATGQGRSSDVNLTRFQFEPRRGTVCCR